MLRESAPSPEERKELDWIADEIGWIFSTYNSIRNTMFLALLRQSIIMRDPTRLIFALYSLAERGVDQNQYSSPDINETLRERINEFVARIRALSDGIPWDILQAGLNIRYDIQLDDDDIISSSPSSTDQDVQRRDETQPERPQQAGKDAREFLTQIDALFSDSSRNWHSWRWEIDNRRKIVDLKLCLSDSFLPDHLIDHRNNNFTKPDIFSTFPGYGFDNLLARIENRRVKTILDQDDFLYLQIL